MLDSYQRSISYLRLSVTDLCNFRCQYCMPAQGVQKLPHEQILSVEECIELVRQAADCGIRKIRLTGGEPLVRRGILDICRGISSIPGIEELCLTTNGSLLKRFAEPLRQAGVHRLNISLDTLRADRFQNITRCNSLQDVLDGIAAAESAGFYNLKIDAVLIGGFNDDEIPDFIQLTQHHPWEIRFIELMPMGECASWAQERFLHADTVLQRCPSLKPIAAQGVARRYQISGYSGTVGLIEPMSHRFCKDCSRIRVTADGKLKSCLHSADEINLKGLCGDELKKAIQRGIEQKPLRHFLVENGKSAAARNMNQIGG